MELNFRKKLSNASFGPHDRGGPLVSELFNLIKESPFTLSEVAARAGLDKGVISLWGVSTNPRLYNFIAVLNALGYKLEIVKCK